MELIIGGAYQGKLEYALENYGLTADDVFTCKEDSTAIGFDEKIVYHFEKYVLALEKAGQDPERTVRTMIPAGRFKDRIIIADDISQGVVPTDQTERAWREDTGRCLVMLAKEADKVTRVFCGIPQVIKGADNNEGSKETAAGKSGDADAGSKAATDSAGKGSPGSGNANAAGDTADDTASGPQVQFGRQQNQGGGKWGR